MTDDGIPSAAAEEPAIIIITACDSPSAAAAAEEPATATAAAAAEPPMGIEPPRRHRGRPFSRGRRGFTTETMTDDGSPRPSTSAQAAMAHDSPKPSTSAQAGIAAEKSRPMIKVKSEVLNYYLADLPEYKGPQWHTPQTAAAEGGQDSSSDTEPDPSIYYGSEYESDSAMSLD